jgi:hypothetical protein
MATQMRVFCAKQTAWRRCTPVAPIFRNLPQQARLWRVPGTLRGIGNGFYSYRNASAGRIRDAEYDG